MRLPLLLLLLFGISASARAEPAVDEAVRAYDALEFERCLELLASVSVDVPAQQARAALYRGLCQFNLAQAAAARAAFDEALKLAPELTLPPDVSPRISELFESVRAAQRPAQPPSLLPQSVPEPDGLRLLTVEQPLKKRSLTGPLVVGGVGVAAVLVASTFGVLAKSNEASANGARFTSDAGTYAASARQSATIANVSWVCAGVALAVAGGWFGYAQLSGATSP